MNLWDLVLKMPHLRAILALLLSDMTKDQASEIRWLLTPLIAAEKTFIDAQRNLEIIRTKFFNAVNEATEKDK